jgi:acyl-CoA thioesterase I
MKYFAFVLGIIFVLTVSCSRNIKIACVGDSITEGWGLTDQSKSAYPVQLDKLLGKGYTVLNCGHSGATLLKNGDLPYWECKEFYDVFAYKPDKILIMLGTNDTKPHNWNTASFVRDCQAMVDTFRSLSPKPELWFCLPVPVFETAWGINDSTLTTYIIPALKEIVAKNNLHSIDMYHQMLDQRGNFPDNIHPNEKAAEKMASIIADEIKKK